MSIRQDHQTFMNAVLVLWNEAAALRRDRAGFDPENPEDNEPTPLHVGPTGGENSTGDKREEEGTV